MRTIIVRKLGLRNWMCNVVTPHFESMALVTDLPSKAEALSIGEVFVGDWFMSMQDNPLIGEYTKGISKGRGYFVNLERRARREKAPLRNVAKDLTNPLFAMLRQPITPTQMVNGLDQVKAKKVAAQPVDKSKKPVDNLPKQARKPVILTSFADLRQALAGTVFEKR